MLGETYLQRITPICLSIDHVKDLLLHMVTCRVPSGPVVPRANALLPDEEVFGVVDVSIRSGLDAIDDLTSDQLTSAGKPEETHTLGSKSSKIARGIYLVSSLCSPRISILRWPRLIEMYLVEKHVLAITALGRKLLQVAVLADAMLQTELLPELAPD